MKQSAGEKTFGVLNNLFMVIISITMLYPFLNTFAKSLSSNHAILSGQVYAFPIGLQTYAYQSVLKNSALVRVFQNTIYIAIVGTIIHMVVVLAAAYSLSRKELVARKQIFHYFLFTMFFGGGIIPTFLLIKDIGLYDNLWALMLPGAMSVYQMIISRSFFQDLPESVIESASLDGCNDIGIFARIVLPMSKPIIATIALFSVVGLWNTFMAGILYIRSPKNYPLQVMVREIVFQNDLAMNSASDAAMSELDKDVYGTESLKSAVLMVSSLPIICVYPFLQKYFVKGLTLGAVKG